MSSSVILAVQLFNKIKKKKRRKEEKNKHVSLYFPHVMSNSFIFGKFVILYVLDIYVSRNGIILKLKVKSIFSLSMGLRLINIAIPIYTVYIYTTVLCHTLSKVPYLYTMLISINN